MLRVLLMGTGVAATVLVGSVAAAETGTDVAVAAPVAAPAEVAPEPSAEPVPEPEDPREEDGNAEEPSAEPAPPPEDPREEDENEEEPSPDPPPEPSPEPGPEPEDPREDEEESEEEEPSPAPAPEPEAPSEGEDECGPVDVPCMVVNGFFGWINEVVADFLNSGLMLAGVSMMLMTPSSSGIQSVWEASAGIVNTSFVLIVTAAGVLVMGHQTVQTSTGIKEILPRLVLAFIAVNASWFICQQLGLLASAVSVAILGETADEDSVNQAMARFLSNPRDEGLITAGFMLMAAVAGVIFVFTVIIRLMLWILLTAAAPLALAAHALPQTQGLARLWWRAIGALLIMQVGQALVLRMVMTLFLEREGLSMFDPLGTAGSLIELQVLLACLYVLIRVPFWAGKQIFNPSASPLVKGAKLATSILLFKGLGVGKAAAGQKAGKALTSAKSGAVGQRMAAPRPPSGPAPRTPSTPGTPRWRQSELPGMRPGSSAGSGPATGTQRPLPGIDSQIDPAEQRRLRERRRWVQPTLPSGEADRPPHHRQDPLPGMEDTPRAHQDPLPGMSNPAQARQESLFETTSGMRRPPAQRRSGFQERQHQSERRRRAARQAAAQQPLPGRRQIPPRHRGRNPRGRF